MITPVAKLTAGSIHAQGRQRIDSRCSTGREIAGQRGGCDQQDTDGEEREGIGGAHAVQQAGHHFSQKHGHRNAYRQSGENQPQALS